MPCGEISGWSSKLDGHHSHARAAAAERDRQRDLELRAEGYAVLRYTWQQVTRQSALVVADLRAHLTASQGAAQEQNTRT